MWRPHVGGSRRGRYSPVPAHAAPRSRIRRGYTTDPAVVRSVKARARGYSELTGREAGFTDRKGEPYLEVHHPWPAEEGTMRAIALRPEEHSEIHHGADGAALNEACKDKLRAMYPKEAV